MVRSTVRFVTSLALVLLLAACASEPKDDADAPASAEAYAPGATGELRQSEVVLPGETTPTRITYEVIDGLAIFQGDIVLGPADELANQAIAISGADPRWPDGIVPYTIDSSLNATMRSRVNAAIAHWEANTNVQLVPRDGETDYVEFASGDGCSSAVGREGGKQIIRLANGCSTGNAIHEIGHAVGLWHEQSRNDRDQHVEILIDNVQQDKRGNFDLHDDDGTDVDAYDFGSIMHYPAKAFGIEDPDGTKRTTIRTIPPGMAIGQRTGLSDLDVAAANRLYPAQTPPYLVIDPLDGSPFDENDAIAFSATVVDAIDVDLNDYTISWSYEQWNGVPFFFGSTAPGAEATRSFCDGVYTVDAEASNSQTGGTAVASVTFTVANADPKPARCGWSIDIVEPIDGQVFTTNDTVRLRAVIDDDHPETDAPLAPVIWRDGGPTGLIIQQPDILDFTRSKWGVGQHDIHVDYGGEASDQISFEIIETTNTSPTVTIDSPSDGQTVNYVDYPSGASSMELPVSGSADDAEDGPLSGASLTWTWRVEGATEWRTGGQGGDTTITLPFSSISPSANIEIRLAAEDSEGLIGDQIITIFVLGVIS